VDQSTVLLFALLAVAAAGGVYLLMRPKGETVVVSPLAPSLIDEPANEAGEVAAALPAGVTPILEFDGPPGRVVLSKPEVQIGRHSEDDVHVSDITVSRHHARIVARPDGGFDLINQTAARSDPNPILVNGKDQEQARLRDGDKVEIGATAFVFRLANA
jgi:hypothetical protein